MQSSVLHKCPRTLAPAAFSHHSAASRRATCSRPEPRRSKSSLALALPPNTFEPHLDGGTLASQLLVLAVTFGGALYWWLEVVPSARRDLAKEKRQGEVRQLLEEIQRQPESKRLERWFYSDWLQQLERRQEMAQRASQKRAAAGLASSSTGAETATEARDVPGKESLSVRPADQGAAVAAETRSQLASSADQCSTQSAHPRQETSQGSTQRKQGDETSSVGQSSQQEDGNDEDKQPRFWSADNPLVAVALLLGIAVVRTVVFHQGSS